MTLNLSVRLSTAVTLSLFFVTTFGSVASMPRGDSDDDQVALSQPLTVKWRYDSDQTTDLTPASDGTSVYLPLVRGRIVSLNANNGQLRWVADEGGQVTAAPTADDRSLYVATQYENSIDAQHRLRGALRSLSKGTGVTIWMRTLQSPLLGGIVVGARAVFGGGADGRVQAFDKQTGQTLWATQYTAPFSSQPRLSGNRLYLGSEDGTLLALDQETGMIAWHYHTSGPIRGPATIVQGIVYFGSGDGYVYAYNEVRGHLVWRRRTGAGVQAVAAVESGVIVASLDNFVYFFSLNGGHHLWRHQLPGRISSQPATATDGALFTPLSSDTAIVLSLGDGKPINSLPMGDENTRGASPIISAQAVMITTPRGLVAFAAPGAR